LKDVLPLQRVLILAKKKKKKDSSWSLILIIAAVLAVLLYFHLKAESQPEVVAVVNNEEITMHQLKAQYNIMEFDEDVSELEFLDTLIDRALIIQDAKKKGITATDEEIDILIQMTLEHNRMTLKQYEEKIAELNVTLDDVKERYAYNIIVVKLVNEVTDGLVDVNQKQVYQLYKETELRKKNISLATVEAQIKNKLKDEKRIKIFETYVRQLRQDANITIFMKNNEFEETNDAVCYEDNKPEVLLFCKRNSIPCQKANRIFANAVNGNDKIKAHIWILDEGDDKLTAEKEKGVPKKDLALFSRYSDNGAVPSYVIGCAYTRIGNTNEDKIKEAIKGMLNE